MPSPGPRSRSRSPAPRRRAAAPAVAEGGGLDAAEASLGPVLDFMRTLWQVDHCLFAATREQLRALGITGPQRLVLRIVARNPGISPGDLSAVLHLHPSTVTGLVKRLSRSGLLLRGVHARDGRRAVLTLTRRGMALGLEPGPAEVLTQGALEVLDPSDVAVAKAVLRSVARALTGLPPGLGRGAARRTHRRRK